MRRSRLLLASSLLLAVAAGLHAACTKEEKEPRGGTGTVELTGIRDSGRNTPPEGAGSASAIAAEKRPPPAFRFEDATVPSGVSSMNHSGRAGVKEYLPEAVGVGPAWLDYDHDGRMDLYVPDGDVFSNYVLVREPDPKDSNRSRPVLRPKDSKPEKDTFHAHLWHNLGGGRFEDVAATAGVRNDRWGFGACAWDYDGDGWTDLYVCNF